LPVSHGLQDFYLNHTGDYANGIVNAAITDLVLDYATQRAYAWSESHVSKTNPLYKTVKLLYDHPAINTALSTVFSVGLVIVEETKGIIGTPDLKDIPMGIAGALTHLALRYVALKKDQKNECQTKIESAVA
jgi:hypothetical protein